MRLSLDLDSETAAVLIEAALADVRNPGQQAVVALRRGLGPPVPYPTEPAHKSREPVPAGSPQ